MVCSALVTGKSKKYCNINSVFFLITIVVAEDG